MDKKEFDSLVKQLHEQGLDDDKIMNVLYETFRSHKCSIEDYEIMVKWLGYDLTDDFYTAHGIKRSNK